MSRYTLLVLAFGWLLTSTILGQQLPPGYQGVIQITNDNAFNQRPAMNNRGQFVFAKRFDPYNQYTSEIFLYDMPSGEFTRLTFDDVCDQFPDINDAGEITWSRMVGEGDTYEIVYQCEQQLTRLTFDDLSDYGPAINNNGLIAWYKVTGEGCLQADADIYLYDGQTIERITFGGFSNQGPCLNDLDDIVWSQKNFCNWPWWTSQILMRSEGVITPLTGDQAAPQLARINNDRLVAWQHDEPGWNKHIRTWQEGVTTVLTDWGGGLRLNNRGDIVFNRWYEDSQTWQVWLYYRDEFWQITDDPFWNCDGDITDHGDIAWMGGPGSVSLVTNIKLLKRFPGGDVNCDGATDAFDIDPFVLALTDPPGYESSYPDCDYLLADFDANGVVDAFDIDPFVGVLTGG